MTPCQAGQAGVTQKLAFADALSSPSETVALGA